MTVVYRIASTPAMAPSTLEQPLTDTSIFGTFRPAPVPKIRTPSPGGSLREGSSRIGAPDSDSFVKGAPIVIDTERRVHTPPDHHQYETTVSSKAISEMTEMSMEFKLQQHRVDIAHDIQKACGSVSQELKALLRQEVLRAKHEMREALTMVRIESTDQVKAVRTPLDEIQAEVKLIRVANVEMAKSFKSYVDNELKSLSSSVNEEFGRMVTQVNAVSEACEEHFERLEIKNDKSLATLQSTVQALQAIVQDTRNEVSATRNEVSARSSSVSDIEQLRQDLAEAIASARRELSCEKQEQLDKLRQDLDSALAQSEKNRQLDNGQLLQMAQNESQARMEQGASLAETQTKLENRLLELETSSAKTCQVYDWMVSKRAKEKVQSMQAPQTLDHYRAVLSMREFAE